MKHKNVFSWQHYSTICCSRCVQATKKISASNANERIRSIFIAVQTTRTRIVMTIASLAVVTSSRASFNRSGTGIRKKVYVKKFSFLFGGSITHRRLLFFFGVVPPRVEIETCNLICLVVCAHETIADTLSLEKILESGSEL